jgi:tripartite-type tricarboxylate transporter receptor subunit TctC
VAVNFRRSYAFLCVAFLTLFLGVTAIAAEIYPSRPIRLLIGFSPGGPADIPGRAIAERLSQSLGVPVVPENKPGAGGMLAMQELMSQPADGHTLLLCTYFDPVNTLIYRSARYKVSDISPISLIGTYDYVLAVSKNIFVEKLSDLIALTKVSPDKFNYGHIGVASPANLIFKQLEHRTGMKMTAVPFKGSAPAIQELIAGRIDMYIVPPISAVQPFDAKQIKILATTGKSRLNVMPQVETLQELGVDLVSFAFVGVCAASGTPAPIIERLNRLVREAVASPQYERLMKTLGSVPTSSSSQELQTVIDNAVRDTAPIVKEFNLRMD